jgi:hypothetical protein
LIDIDYAITPLIADISNISDYWYYAIAAIIIDAITPHYYFLLLLSRWLAFSIDYFQIRYAFAILHNSWQSLHIFADIIADI